MGGEQSTPARGVVAPQPVTRFVPLIPVLFRTVCVLTMVASTRTEERAIICCTVTVQQCQYTVSVHSVVGGGLFFTACECLEGEKPQDWGISSGKPSALEYKVSRRCNNKASLAEGREGGSCLISPTP